MEEKLKIGIISYNGIKERTIAIAEGGYKPLPDEPKIWFTSRKSIAEVLSPENEALMSLILEKQPASVTALAELTGRQKSNLLRTLRTLEHYGMVKLIPAKQSGKKGRPALRPELAAECIEVVEVIDFRKPGIHRNVA